MRQLQEIACHLSDVQRQAAMGPLSAALLREKSLQSFLPVDKLNS
jgi:hypothetical protein